jgi:hypothetical protein
MMVETANYESLEKMTEESKNGRVVIKNLDRNAFYCYSVPVFYRKKKACRHVAQGESITLTRWGSRVQIPACLPFT